MEENENSFQLGDKVKIIGSAHRYAGHTGKHNLGQAVAYVASLFEKNSELMKLAASASRN
jgi:hypothetical protein